MSYRLLQVSQKTNQPTKIGGGIEEGHSQPFHSLKYWTIMGKPSQQRRHKRPQRRRKRNRSTDNSSTKETDDDILEQLQKQRAQQRQEDDITKEKPEILGNYIYDKQRDAYFPAGDSSSSSPQLTTPSISNVCRTSVPDLLARRERTCSVSKRRHLSWNALSKTILKSAQLVPNSSRNQDGEWTNHFQGKLKDDVDCKLHAPLWSRTFDVWESDFTTLVGDRAVLWTQGQTVSILGCTHVQFLKDGRVGIIQKEAGNSSSFASFSAQSTTVNLFSIPRVANGFCHYEGNKVVLANSKPSSCSGKTGPWIVDLEGGGRPYRMDVKVPVSDSLCVNSFDSSKIVLGHRDGQISMIDPTDKVSLVTERNTESGPIVNIECLASNQLLCRTYSGVVRLFDLRMISSPLHEFSAPLSNPRLTSKCSGLATDPDGSTLLTPFVDAEEVPRLGVWSLHTGDFVGSQALAVDDVTPACSTWGINWVELCPRVTDGYQWEVGRHVCSMDATRHAWGLWYKCGQSATPEVGPWAGSIHHVCVNTRS